MNNLFKKKPPVKLEDIQDKMMTTPEQTPQVPLPAAPQFPVQQQQPVQQQPELPPLTLEDIGEGLQDMYLRLQQDINVIAQNQLNWNTQFLELKNELMSLQAQLRDKKKK